MEVAWFTHPSFRKLFANNWCYMKGKITLTTSRFGAIVRQWNAMILGIFFVKRRLLALLSGIQRKLGEQPNGFLEWLKMKFIAERGAPLVSQIAV